MIQRQTERDNILLDFLSCRIVMHDPKHADLTGNEEFTWGRCVIKWSSIKYIRECTMEEDFKGNGVVHFSNDEYCITDMSFEDLLKWWASSFTEK